MSKAKRVTVTLTALQEDFFEAAKRSLNSLDPGNTVTDSEIISRMLVYCVSIEYVSNFVKYFLKKQDPKG